jgi:hypothetical protein
MGTAWERHGNGMACVNQTRPHNVNQMGKTQSNDLAERHGRGTAGEQQGNGMGTAWERHGMCKSALSTPETNNTKIYALTTMFEFTVMFVVRLLPRSK